MRVSQRRFRIEELEARDVPAMIVPTLDPGRAAIAVVISTPDHAHAAVVRQVLQADGKAVVQTNGFTSPAVLPMPGALARIGPIIDTRL